MIRAAFLLVLALASAPAAAQPSGAAPAPAGIDEPHRLQLMRALHQIGVEVGAVWPIGDSVYEVMEIKLGRTAAGEITITVRTRLLK
jgi:hypothetical protein